MHVLAELRTTSPDRVIDAQLSLTEPVNCDVGRISQLLSNLVANALGKPLRPSAIHFVSDLPRTRNAKILRRVVKSVYTGTDPGDLSSLENPSALAAIGATRS